MIRVCKESDFKRIVKIINDAAHAYRGIIPEDRWQEPYMPSDELRKEIENGVFFWGLEYDGQLLGVMGIQNKGEVTLGSRGVCAAIYGSSGGGWVTGVYVLLA